jgi:hypothetical protein
MGILGRIALVAILTGAAGCSGESGRGAQGKRVSGAALAAKPPAARSKPESLYDAEGRLKPSDHSVGWLAIPVGLKAHEGGGRQHLFSGKVPLKAVAKFLDARVFTSKLEASARRVHYGAAQPKNLDPKAVRLDISLYGNAHGDFVELIIEEHTTNSQGTLTPAEARSLISQQQSRAE